LILLGALLVCLAAAEAGVRLLHLAPPVRETSGEGLYENHPGGLYRLRPGIERAWEHREFRGGFRTNAAGFRGGPWRPGPGGSLVVLGDSFVFGWGVDEGETLPELLQELLGDSVAVVNLGLPGYGPGRELALWRSGVFPHPVRLVCLVLTESNDVVDDLAFARDPERLPGPPGGLARRSALVRWLAWRWDGLRRWWISTREENVRRTLGYVAELSRDLTRRGIPLVVVLFPSRAQIQPGRLGRLVLDALQVRRDLHERLLRGLREIPGVSEVVDLTPVMEKHGDALYFPADGHPTAEAYRLAARRLAPVLRRRLQAP
jgi:hypothetical protein